MPYDLIEKLRLMAIDTFHVDPVIFVAVYLFTVPPNWLSTFLMVRSAFRTYRETKRISFKVLLTKSDFLAGLILCILTIIAPYIYVLFWGENLPLWFYVYLAVLLFLIPYIIAKKVKKGVMAKKFEYKIADDSEKLQGLLLVNKRYCEKGYLPATECGKSFDDVYVKHSVYIVAKSAEKVVGVIRIVENSDDGLPVLNEFELYKPERERLQKIPQNRIVEIGNLAAEPRQGIAGGLYRAAYRYCIKNKKTPIAAMGEDLLERLIGKYWFANFAYRRIGETKYYIGGDCAPILLKPKRLFLIFL